MVRARKKARKVTGGLGFGCRFSGSSALRVWLEGVRFRVVGLGFTAV